MVNSTSTALWIAHHPPREVPVSFQGSGTPIVSVDIGGTSLKAGRFNPEWDTLEAIRREPTPKEPASFVEGMARLIRTVMPQSAGKLRVGVSCGGVWDSKNGVSLGIVGNLPALQKDPYLGVALRKAMSPKQVQMVFENDANTAAYAESKLGAARQVQNSVLIILGTGIGGGIIRNGELARGANHSAGEIGHTVISLEKDRQCTLCGNIGCFETFGSGPGLIQTAQKVLQSDPQASSSLLLATGKPIEAIGTADIVQAWQVGDPTALKIRDLWHQHLAIGIRNVIATEDPELIVLGGGMSQFVDYDQLNAMLASMLEKMHPTAAVPVVKAQLGNDAGMIGAALLAEKTFPTFTEKLKNLFQWKKAHA